MSKSYTYESKLLTWKCVRIFTVPNSLQWMREEGNYHYDCSKLKVYVFI